MRIIGSQGLGIALIVVIAVGGYCLAEFNLGGYLSWAAKNELPKSFPLVGWSGDGEKVLWASRGGPDQQAAVGLENLAGPGTAWGLDLPPDVIVVQTRLAPDGRHAAVVTGRSELIWHDIVSSEQRLLIAAPAGMNSLFHTALTRNGQYLACAQHGERCCIHVLRLEPEPMHGLLPLPQGGSTESLHFSNDGKKLLSTHDDGSVFIWDVAGLRREGQLVGHREHSRVMASFCGTSDRVISADYDGSIRDWHLPEERATWTGSFPCGGTHAFAVSNDGRSAAWGGAGGKVMVWDCFSHVVRFEIAVPLNLVMQLEFSPDDRLLAVAGIGGSIHIFDCLSGILVRTMGGPERIK